MGLEIEVYVGPASELLKWTARVPRTLIYRLPQELGLVPVTWGFADDVRNILGNQKLESEELITAWGIEASENSVVAYVSASYFGGSGAQKAVVWKNRKVLRTGIAINKALRLLGVKAGGKKDEFDTVGLGRFGRTRDWENAATREARLLESGAELRDTTARGMDRYEVADGVAISVLLDIAKQANRYAALDLGKFGPDAVPALIELLAPDVLEDPWPVVRALGQIGTPAAAAVPLLVSVLQTHQRFHVRLQAAETLGKIAEPTAVVLPALIGALKTDRDKSVRRHAAKAIGEIVSESKNLSAAGQTKAAIAALLEARKDPCEWVRKDSLEGLVSFAAATQQGSAIEETMLALEEALNDNSYAVCKAAIQGVGQLGQAIPESFPIYKAIATLRPRIRDKSLRVEAAKALGQIACASKEEFARKQVIDVLRKAQSNRDWEVRRVAAQFFGMLASVAEGPHRDEAITALNSALKDPTPTVRHTAAEALRRIRTSLSSLLQIVSEKKKKRRPTRN